MGNTVSGVITELGDLFYPSNPKLRERCAELQGDIDHIGMNFDDAKERYDELDFQLQDTINNYLVAHSYSSFGELDDEIRARLDGDAVAEWQELDKKFGDMENISWAIKIVESSLVLGGAGALTAGVAIGVVSLSTAFVAFAAISGIVLLLGIATAGAALFIGGQVQKELKEAVEDLFYARAEAKLQYNRLQLLNQFMGSMAKWIEMADDVRLEHYDTLWEMIQMLNTGQWTIEYANEGLEQLDQYRDSWTGADPPPLVSEDNNSEAIIVKANIPALWKAADKLFPTGDGSIAGGTAAGQATSTAPYPMANATAIPAGVAYPMLNGTVHLNSTIMNATALNTTLPSFSMHLLVPTAVLVSG
ncbi:hypothetical protein MKZ38_008101 [Zalerion maritima]|uniref:Uncharacterized protein n=1 Tax=Zalerion maritima TaxID=339359 RepID=A0AAD5RUK1_9PEZI|nr:hypothetical protein MKZ38_008101 [Zalerion maritima]